MSRTKKLPPIHPGEILLEEFLKPLAMSMNKLAEELHVPANRITQIVGVGAASLAKPRSGLHATLALLRNSGWVCRRITICRSLAMSLRRKLSVKFSPVTKQPEPMNIRNSQLIQK